MPAMTVNDRPVMFDMDPETPLLWALRDHLHLYGTKYGCGIGVCGSCTVHVDARAVRACMLSVAEVGDKVLFSPDDRYEVEVGGEELIMLRERDLHAVAAHRIESSTGLYL